MALNAEEEREDPSTLATEGFKLPTTTSSSEGSTNPQGSEMALIFSGSEEVL